LDLLVEGLEERRVGYRRDMSATRRPDASPRRARFPSVRWWLSDRDGHVVLAQPPNAAITVWLASVLIGWTDVLDHDREAVLTRVGQGALVVWSLDEVLRGSTPARRLLGAVVLVVVVVRLFA
jgi:hypothetical protein